MDHGEASGDLEKLLQWSNLYGMEVEDVKVSYYDVMRMVGKIVISRESQSFQTHLDDRTVLGLLEDCWKQTPGKIMFGDRWMDGVRLFLFLTRETTVEIMQLRESSLNFLKFSRIVQLVLE